MSFEIKQKTQVKVKIYGEEFELRKPTVKQIEDLEKNGGLGKGDDESDANSFSKLVDMLDILGMPKSFSKDMEADHLNQLVNYLVNEFNNNSAKKK